jgi:TonB family protein
MKKALLLIGFLVMGFAVRSQQAEVLTTAEQMPVFPGGEEGLKEYLIKNIKYPDEAVQKAVEGVSYVTFVVSSTGEVTGAQILRGANEQLNQEALRVVNAMPHWQPAMKDGHAVSVKYTLPIRFSLDVVDKKNGR